MAEVAERLTRFPLRLVAGEYGRDLLGEIVEGDDVLVLLVEPVAEQAAAEEDRVLAEGAADDADVGVVGAGAGVGAAGHPQREGVVRQAESCDLRLERIDQAREHPLALRHGEAAGGQGDAGHAPAAQG